MKRLLLLALLLAVTVPAVPQTQPQKPAPRPVAAQDYLEVGSARVWLGMSKEQASQALQSYDVTQKGDHWYVFSVPGQSLIVLEFTDERLNYASSTWHVKDDDTVSAVFGALGSLGLRPGDSSQLCLVSTDVVAKPAVTANRVLIRCGQKCVLILTGTISDRSRSASGPLVVVSLGQQKEP